MNEADLLGVRFGEVVELGLGCGCTIGTDVSVCSGAEEVTSRRDHFLLTARDLSRTPALNKVSLQPVSVHGQRTLVYKTGRSFVCRKLSGRVDIVISPCKVVRWRVLIPSTLFVKKVGQCFSRSGTLAEFLDETGVSLHGRIATNDSREPDARVELTVEGASVTVTQNIEYSG